MTRRRTARVCTVLLAIMVAGCTRVTDAPPSSALGRLVGRCVRVREPLLIVDGDDAPPVNSSLAPANQPSDAPPGIGHLAEGDELVVERVLLKRTLGDHYSLVIGRTTKYPRLHIAMFYVVDHEWLWRAEEEVFVEHRPPPPRTNAGGEVLVPELAGWCDAARR